MLSNSARVGLLLRSVDRLGLKISPAASAKPPYMSPVFCADAMANWPAVADGPAYGLFGFHLATSRGAAFVLASGALYFGPPCHSGIFIDDEFVLAKGAL